MDSIVYFISYVQVRGVLHYYTPHYKLHIGTTYTYVLHLITIVIKCIIYLYIYL